MPETISERPEGGHRRWAIQMATVNTFKYRGHDRLARVFGRHSIEHSYTRLAEIWCDRDGEPLKNSGTGKFYPPLTVRGGLNPGAINPKNGHWTAMKFSSLFNRALPKSDLTSDKRFKLGVFSFYGEENCNTGIFNPDVAVEDPVTVMVGDQFAMEAEWLVRQQRAMRMNAQELDYDLANCNCHTVTVTLNKQNVSAVEKFAKNGVLRWGANPDGIMISADIPEVIRSLEDLQRENLSHAYAINRGHDVRAARYQEPSVVEPE